MIFHCYQSFFYKNSLENILTLSYLWSMKFTETSNELSKVLLFTDFFLIFPKTPNSFIYINFIYANPRFISNNPETLPTSKWCLFTKAVCFSTEMWDIRVKRVRESSESKIFSRENVENSTFFNYNRSSKIKLCSSHTNCLNLSILQKKRMKDFFGA